MTIQLHNSIDAPTTSYPEYERIFEIRFRGDEGLNPTTYAVVDLDACGNLPEDLEDELRGEIRRHMGKAKANRFEGFEDVTDYLNDRAHAYCDMDDLKFAIEQTLGENAPDYDVEGIAREISDWRDGQLVADLEREDYWHIVAQYQN
jgi:hypothetical protein